MACGDALFRLLAVLSPLSSLVLWMGVRSVIDSSDQRGYLLYVGVPRLVSFVTAPFVVRWILRSEKTPGCCGVGSGDGCPCPAWWMLGQALVMDVWGAARGLDERQLASYEEQRGNRQVTESALACSCYSR